MRKNAVLIVIGLIVLAGIIYALARNAETNTNTNENENAAVTENENVSVETNENVSVAENVNTAANTNVAATNTATVANTNTAKNTNTASAAKTFDFLTPKKSAHFVSSTPGNGTVLKAAPTEVVITCNADLTAASTISVMKDGTEYSTGSVSGTQVLHKSLSANAPDGLYTVNYRVCTSDDCSSGYFQFALDSTRT